MDDYPKTIEGFLQRIAKLEKTIAELQEQLEQQQRTNARQAAPFRRQERNKISNDQKKRPGGKPGHKGTHRPAPKHINQDIEHPLNDCPQFVIVCRGSVSICLVVYRTYLRSRRIIGRSVRCVRR